MSDAAPPVTASAADVLPQSGAESGKGGMRMPASDPSASASDRASSSRRAGISSTSEASGATSAEGGAVGGGQAPGKPLGSGAPGTDTG
ncbi:hypothetical protein SSPO_033000 [Streptomyces antimycoticus]|uniref:Uncharacterized protein n=1 Tax=Streptomyces antimycoticus TaxID=68175 RepID=A0A499UIL7_9ACTN|nr:hypothetical protein SSPO_033000 [Streptomyces antimycoticus]